MCQGLPRIASLGALPALRMVRLSKCMVLKIWGYFFTMTLILAACEPKYQTHTHTLQEVVYRHVTVWSELGTLVILLGIS